MDASTSGRPSTPERLIPPELALFGNPRPSHNASVEERVGLLLNAAYDGYVPKIQRLATRLTKYSGMSVHEAVKSIRGPWNKCHGPLHMAAAAGKIKACKYLIEDLKLNVNGDGTGGATPLIFATHGTGSLAVVKLLLDNGADPNRRDIQWSYPLHIAAIRGDYEIAELLLSKGAFVNALWESKSPVYLAALYGKARMVELLLHHHADINDRVYTPLHAAISAQSLIILDLLIKAGAPVNIGWPETPLIAAAAAGLTDLVKRLLEANADANIPDDNGMVAVEIAAIQGWQECVEVLFPVTAPLARVANWSIEGLLEHARFMSSQQQHPVLHEDNEPGYEAEGDATFGRRDYSHALTLYTMAMEIDPDNSTLYAKRSLCRLYTGSEEELSKKKGGEEEALKDATEDATIYKNRVQPDLPNGEALNLVKEYGSTCGAILPGLNPDF